MLEGWSEENSMKEPEKVHRRRRRPSERWGRQPSDLDIQLHLAGVLPRRTALVLRIRALLDRQLQTRLAEARSSRDRFARESQPRLHERLFAGDALSSAESAGKEGRAGMLRRFLDLVAVPRSGAPWFALAATGCLALGLSTMLWLTSLFPNAISPPIQGLSATSSDSDFGTKGGSSDDSLDGSLGIHLYVKGVSTYRVEGHQAKLNPSDTLQVIPLGERPQHLWLLGWDPSQGLVPLFPEKDTLSRPVSPESLPPALVPQGDGRENHLICVSSTSPIALSEVRRLLESQMTTQQEPGMPSAFFSSGAYVQRFNFESAAP